MQPNKLNPADKGARVGNYMADSICFLLIVILQANIFGGLFHIIPDEGSSFSGIYYLLLYFSYYFFFEFFMDKTPGKWLTKTVVVHRSGKRPGFKSYLFRTICRLIPIDAFSYLFGAGLHDIISQTQVVYTKEKPGGI